MKRLLPLALLPFLAACEAPSDATGDAAVAEPLPPQVLSALPAGVPPSVVVRNSDGCYLLSVEVTTPPSGYPLRDAAGNVVCDAGSAPAIAPSDLGALPPPALGDASTLAPGSITPPAPLAPLNPA